MLHCPVCPPETLNPKQTLNETWRGLELLLESETCRTIGVSNFQVNKNEIKDEWPKQLKFSWQFWKEKDLESLIEECCVVPHVNQCEFHPFQNPKSLRKFCTENKIAFQVVRFSIFWLKHFYRHHTFLIGPLSSSQRKTFIRRTHFENSWWFGKKACWGTYCLVNSKWCHNYS